MTTPSQKVTSKQKKVKERMKKYRVWDIYKKKYIPEDVYKLYPEPIGRATGRMTKDWEDYKEGESFYPEYQKLEEVA